MSALTLYAPLTDPDEAGPMQVRSAAYLKLMGFCLAALSIAACAELAPVGLPLVAPEPRNSPLPPDMLTPAAEQRNEQSHVLALESRVRDMHAQLANIREALRLMGPLPLEETSESDAPATAPAADPVPRRPIHGVALAPATDIVEVRDAPIGLAGHAALFGVGARNVDGFGVFEAVLDGVQPAFFAGQAPANDALCVDPATLGEACRGFAPVRAS